MSFLSSNAYHSFLSPFSLYPFHLYFFLSEQYLTAKRLTILSALGSALVTRVPIDRCRSPSSHFRIPLHLLATAILMKSSPSRLTGNRTLKPFLQVWCLAYDKYRTCLMKLKIKKLWICPQLMFQDMIRAYVWQHMCECMCSRVYSVITTYTRCLHSAKMTHRARVRVYRSVCVYVAPGLSPVRRITHLLIHAY